MKSHHAAQTPASTSRGTASAAAIRTRERRSSAQTEFAYFAFFLYLSYQRFWRSFRLDRMRASASSADSEVGRIVVGLLPWGLVGVAFGKDDGVSFRDFTTGTHVPAAMEEVRPTPDCDCSPDPLVFFVSRVFEPDEVEAGAHGVVSSFTMPLPERKMRSGFMTWAVPGAASSVSEWDRLQYRVSQRPNAPARLLTSH